MEQIKAIETWHNGYHFRSRLEARWAIFFENMGIPYEYEPEGFELGNGERYLPDFLLKGTGLWTGYAEIKPDTPIQPEWLTKIEAVVRGTGTDFHLFCGPPDYRYYKQCLRHENRHETVFWIFIRHGRDNDDGYDLTCEKKVPGPITNEGSIKSAFTKKYIHAVNRSRAERFNQVKNNPEALAKIQERHRVADTKHKEEVKRRGY